MHRSITGTCRKISFSEGVAEPKGLRSEADIRRELAPEDAVGPVGIPAEGTEVSLIPSSIFDAPEQNGHL